MSLTDTEQHSTPLRAKTIWKETFEFGIFIKDQELLYGHFTVKTPDYEHLFVFDAVSIAEKLGNSNRFSFDSDLYINIDNIKELIEKAFTNKQDFLNWLQEEPYTITQVKKNPIEDIRQSFEIIKSFEELGINCLPDTNIKKSSFFYGNDYKRKNLIIAYLS